MSTVISFDYSDLRDVQTYMNDVAKGFAGMKNYASKITTSIVSSLEDWRISGSEPYGHSYVSDSRDSLKSKASELGTNEQKWENAIKTIGDFVKFLEDTDKEVVNIFKTMASTYVDYSGFWGAINWISDGIYNILGVDIANCNVVTRTIADLAKSGLNYVQDAYQDAKDWFEHGNGKYFVNIGKSLLGVGLAVVGTVVACLAIPFSGGTSGAIAVGCIAAGASAISTLITAGNAIVSMRENGKALSYSDSAFDFSSDNPAEARFYGDTAKYSDYVKKHDYGSKEANEAAATRAKVVDTTKAVSDTVGIIAGGVQTFGTKTTVINPDTGQYTQCIDLSAANIKNNILKTFGISATKNYDVNMMETGQGYKVNVDTSADLLTDMDKMDDVSTVAQAGSASYRQTTVIAEGKTITVNKLTADSEYLAVVKTNGTVTAEYAQYAKSAQASSITFDYSKMTSSVNAATKITSPVCTGNLYQLTNGNKNLVSLIQNNMLTTASVLTKADLVLDIAGGEDVTTAYANYKWTGIKAGSAIDKYIISYQGDGEYQIGGGNGKKLTGLSAFGN